MTIQGGLQAFYVSGGPFRAAKPSAYRYLTTNLLTGKLMGDWLPLVPQSFSRVINGAGTLSGPLTLISSDPKQNAANLQAITPRKALLWAFQDGTPVWNGPLWDWVPTSAIGQQLQIQASTMESILAKRIIEIDLVFPAGTDIFDMARGIVQYALNKTPSGQIAGITYAQGYSGITDALTFDGSQNQSAADALTTLVNTYSIEFSFRPYMDADGNLFTSFDLGYPGLGQPSPQSGLAYSYPGNLLDYQFTATGSTSSNRVIATGQSSSNNGSALAGSAIDSTDIANGYPLLEQAVSATGADFTSTSQMDSYAGGVLPSVTATQLAPLLVLGNGQYPPIRVTQLGSYATCAFTSPIHPAQPQGKPGFAATGRIVSWTAYPASDQQAEYAQIQLGAMPFEGSGPP